MNHKTPRIQYCFAASFLASPTTFFQKKSLTKKHVRFRCAQTVASFAGSVATRASRSWLRGFLGVCQATYQKVCQATYQKVCQKMWYIASHTFYYVAWHTFWCFSWYTFGMSLGISFGTLLGTPFGALLFITSLVFFIHCLVHPFWYTKRR